MLSDEKIVKACECDAPIVAEMEATVKQQSSLE